MENSSCEILENRFEEIENEISLLFARIGLFSNLKGYNYLISAVKEVIKKPKMIHAITKELYPTVARAFETTPTGVERNIRNAIEVACNRGRLYSVVNAYYGTNFNRYEKPTNGEFIAFLSDAVTRDFAQDK